MSENTLITAFVIFAIFLFFVAVFLRKMNMRDVFDDNPPSLLKKPVGLRKRKSSQSMQSSSLGPSLDRKKNILDRQKINNVAKVISALGFIILFVPIPEQYRYLGLGIIFLGSIISKASAPPKNQKKIQRQMPNETPTTQRISVLAGKPEYREALKLLSDDYANVALVGEGEKYRRALQYLQTKGIPSPEAKKNLTLLFTLLTRQKNKTA